MPQKYYSIQAQGKRLEDVLSKEELRQLTEYAQLKSPTRATDSNPCREHGDLIEEAETKSTLADQDEAGEAQANVRMGLTAAISILSYFEPDTRDRNPPLPGTKATRKKQQRSHSMRGLLPPQCHRLSSAQVGIRLVTRVSNAQT